jgi:hypothetical protein
MPPSPWHGHLGRDDIARMAMPLKRKSPQRQAGGERETHRPGHSPYRPDRRRVLTLSPIGCTGESVGDGKLELSAGGQITSADPPTYFPAPSRPGSGPGRLHFEARRVILISPLASARS